MNCPYCGEFQNDMCERVPEKQEQHRFVKCENAGCGKVFTAWWSIEYHGLRIEDGGPYSAEQCAELIDVVEQGG